MTTEEMLGRLENEIESDARKMFRWRQTHRVVACAVTLTLIALPVLATLDDLRGFEHYFLFALTVIAAYEGLFRPAVHSARRRADAIDMTDLLWELRSALNTTPVTDAGQRLVVHDRYRLRYQALFRARGKNLIDFSLAQHENDMASNVDARQNERGQREAAEPADAGAVKPNPAHAIAPVAPPTPIAPVAPPAPPTPVAPPAPPAPPAPVDGAANANERRPTEPPVSLEGAARVA